ncbi:sigma factor-like helix-turn-helix DNA-binding protein [Dactylosporangium sp. NPDC049525]|uniref:sigma factor-like helix-turn-helix DNA-binding protein n=1 Tax=Dactylosporangium sp. NPDC049525 TaxID=3154730 RepID=UPI00341BA752
MRPRSATSPRSTAGHRPQPSSPITSTLRSLVAELTSRQRRMLMMRFSDEVSQARIAAEARLSQMHVGRLLRQTLAQLRTGPLEAATLRELRRRGRAARRRMTASPIRAPCGCRHAFRPCPRTGRASASGSPACARRPPG